jgi:hypothetical protein
MSDLIVAIGLVLVLEGVLWTAFPGLGVKLLEAVSETPEARLRLVGSVTAVIGLLVVWLVRG